MITPSLQSELVEIVGDLPSGQQRQVLDFARFLRASAALPPSACGKDLQRFMGRMSEEDARLMQDAIADCERIDPHGW